MTDDRDQLAELATDQGLLADVIYRAYLSRNPYDTVPESAVADAVLASDWLRARDAAIAAAALDEAADELDKPGALKQPLRYRPFREDAAWCNGVISAIALLRARAVAVRGHQEGTQQ